MVGEFKNLLIGLTWVLLFKLRLLTLLSLSHINMTIMPNTSPVCQVFFLRPWLKVSSLTKSNWHALLQLSACPTATSGLWSQAEAVSSILSHCPSSFKDLLRRLCSKLGQKTKISQKLFPRNSFKRGAATFASHVTVSLLQFYFTFATFLKFSVSENATTLLKTVSASRSFFWLFFRQSFFVQPHHRFVRTLWARTQPLSTSYFSHLLEWLL